jgi:hypothetical protein
LWNRSALQTVITPALIFLLGIAGNPDVPRLVRAIEAVENSPWPSEGGGLQWTRAAWFEETREGFYRANQHVFSRNLAAQRLERFIRKLQAMQIPATPYNLALLWNRGWTGGLIRRRNSVRDDYAQRVENYFHAYDH